MSNIAIKGAATGSGTFTLEAPATSTNRTLTLPDEAGTVLTTAGVPSSAMPAGSVLQVVNVTTSAVATGTATIPRDDTIPQITEGTQFMQLAITPTSATSTLQVNVVIFQAGSAGAWHIAALFRDAVSNALATMPYYVETADGGIIASFNYTMTASTTSEIIFRVRTGLDRTGTVTFNGEAGARYYGGTIASSITVKEYAA